MRLTLPLLKRVLRPGYKVSELTKKYANLPEEYIKLFEDKVTYRTPKGINYRQAEEYFPLIPIGVTEPWAFQNQEKKQKVYVEPIREWLFFRGDRVQVLEGKDKGKQGLIIKVIPERNWVIVKGLNTKVVKRPNKGSLPVYAQEERPLLVTSQVALVDPGDLQPTEAEWAYTEDGERVRVSVRTSRIIPLSQQAKETYDYKLPEAYAENVKKDTKAEDMKATFRPKLKTFEMDIAEQHGIEDTRVPARTFWY